jgi:hypothetical protein
MDNTFEVSLTYQQQHFNLPAELITYGYSYKIEVDVFGTIVSFERDEEQHFRAVKNYDVMVLLDSVQKELMEAITEELTLLFKD